MMLSHRTSFFQSSNLIVLDFVVFGIHDSDSEDEFFRVVVVENAVEIFAESLRDFLGDLLHRQFFVRHPFSVQLDTQQPGRNARNVEIGHLVVDVHEILLGKEARKGCSQTGPRGSP